MTRATHLALLATLAIVLGSGAETQAQVGQGNQGSGGGITAGGALGNGTQGSRLGASQSSAVALSSRFQTDSNRFSQGSQALGQTTAGLSAAQGVFGGGAAGGFGGGGRNSLTNQLIGLGAMGAFGGARGGNMFGQNAMGQQQQQGQSQIRTHAVLGFSNPLREQPNSPLVAQYQARVMVRIARVLKRAMPANASTVQVNLEGATAVLQGQVESDHQKRLAELLVKLEPGIATVRNELTVDRNGSTP